MPSEVPAVVDKELQGAWPPAVPRESEATPGLLKKDKPGGLLVDSEEPGDCTYRTCLPFSLCIDSRATHARTLLPAVLVPVSYGWVLVRVRVEGL